MGRDLPPGGPTLIPLWPCNPIGDAGRIISGLRSSLAWLAAGHLGAAGLYGARDDRGALRIGYPGWDCAGPADGGWNDCPQPSLDAILPIPLLTAIIRGISHVLWVMS